MMMHTESWLILAHKEITPTVQNLIDGWSKVYTRMTNADGIRINFHHESKTMDAWRAVESAWELDEEPSEDDEESNPRVQPAATEPAEQAGRGPLGCDELLGADGRSEGKP